VTTAPPPNFVLPIVEFWQLDPPPIDEEMNRRDPSASVQGPSEVVQVAELLPFDLERLVRNVASDLLTLANVIRGNWDTASTRTGATQVLPAAAHPHAAGPRRPCRSCKTNSTERHMRGALLVLARKSLDCMAIPPLATQLDNR
jgi:hypothetical protein